MKRGSLTLLRALPLSALGLIASISFHVVDANSSTFTEQSVATEQNVIYDKDGNQVPSYDKNGNQVPLFDTSSQEPVIEDRGLKQPTTGKRVGKGQACEVNDFFGSGMRHGRHMGGITGNAKNVSFSEKKGAFTGYITDRPDLSAVAQYFTATSSGGPYHAAFHGLLYFEADNPVPGPNYFMQVY